MKIGFLIADDNEFEPLKQKAEKLDTLCSMEAVHLTAGDNEVIAVHCGVGKTNASFGATVLAMQGADAIFCVGYAGGVAFVERGDTVIGTLYYEHDFDLTPLGYKKGQKPLESHYYTADDNLNKAVLSVFPDIKQGVVVSGDCFVSDDALRAWLKDEFNASVCDMESAAAASVCNKLKVPFASIRRISDDAGDNANQLYDNAKNKYEQALIEMALTVAENLGK